MDYKEKLLSFNGTDKYKEEMRFVSSLLKGKTVLDYGCGICTFHHYLNARTEFKCLGYDPNISSYATQDIQLGIAYGVISDQPYDKEFDNIVFMHSISHIDNIYTILKEIKSQVKDQIVVMTPNADWLAQLNNDAYIVDDTVIGHYTIAGLQSLFVSAGYRIDDWGQQGQKIGEFQERLYIIAKPL